MAQTDVIKAYVTILDRCKEHRGPTFEELEEALAAYSDKPPAERTIRRYLKELRENLGIEIRPVGNPKTYRFFPEESVNNVQAIVHYLNLAITAGTLRNAFTSQKEATPYIHADNPDRLLGAQKKGPLGAFL